MHISTVCLFIKHMRKNGKAERERERQRMFPYGGKNIITACLDTEANIKFSNI